MAVENPRAALTILANRGFSAQQIETMLRALVPQQGKQAVELDYELEEFENRARQNGMTPDVANGWGHRLADAWDASVQPGEGAAVIERILPHLFAGGLSQGAAWRYAEDVRAIRAAIAEKQAGVDASSIDTTATAAPDEPQPAYPGSMQPSVGGTPAPAGPVF